MCKIEPLRSWLNMVGRFFAPITDKAIRRGSFRSVELLGKTAQFVTQHNKNLQLFVWTATAYFLSSHNSLD